MFQSRKPPKPETGDRHEASLSSPPPFGEERVEAARKSTRSVSLKSEGRRSTAREITVGRRGGVERLVISRFAGLLDTRFPVIGFRDLEGLSDYRDKERRFPFLFPPFLPSQILSDTRRNDGSVSWPADKCPEKRVRAMATGSDGFFFEAWKTAAFGKRFVSY